MAQRSTHPLLFLFNYTTVKYVVTQNKKIGLLYRIYQLGLMSYLIGYVFVINKRYQAIDDTIESSVVTKVKGVARVNTTDADLWGPEEYVIPDYGGKFLFIITNVNETPNQTLSTCPESASKPFAICTHDDNCTKGEAVRAGNGIKTGICLKTEGGGTCEIYGWCPTEMKEEPEAGTVLRQAENFTVYIRNFVKFSKYNLSLSNIRKENDTSYLKTCLHDEINFPYCPIFRLGDIVRNAGYDFQNASVNGGSIGILINWSCDLDRGSSACHPQYTFMFLGSNEPVKNHFRFARYFNAAGKKYRTLYKVYGFQLDIMVFGTARKFSIINSITNIASVIALMTVGSCICDLILLYLVKNKFSDTKFESLTKTDKEIPLKIQDGMKRKFSF